MLRSLIGNRGAVVRDCKAALVSLIAEYERSANLRLNHAGISAGEIVRHLLDERRLTISSLAKKLEISQSSVSDMLNGRRDWSKTAIVRVSNFFGLQPTLFLR
jgi:antitoxin component HigA of HigAB toxin-antitoxin module